MNHATTRQPPLERDPGRDRYPTRLGLAILGVGLLVYLLGVNPGLFRLDRSPVTGFIQIAVFLAGLALICTGGYITLNSLWDGMQKTISADIGLRLVSTGYVVSVSTGLADVFGFGSHPFPAIPYFGNWQAMGVMLGEALIILGFLLLIPFPHHADDTADSGAADSGDLDPIPPVRQP
jgi:hypothetical protein